MHRYTSLLIALPADSYGTGSGQRNECENAFSHSFAQNQFRVLGSCRIFRIYSVPFRVLACPTKPTIEIMMTGQYNIRRNTRIVYGNKFRKLCARDVLCKIIDAILNSLRAVSRENVEPDICRVYILSMNYYDIYTAYWLRNAGVH